jgi:nicotinamidase/pyrazinamidase
VWQAPSSSEVLLIVDLQNDLVEDDGAVAVPAAERIAERVNVLVGCGRFDVVIAARDWHPPDHRSFAVHGGRWPVHCVGGSIGAELHPALDFSPVTAVVNKGTVRDREGVCAFDGTEVADLLRRYGVGSVTVVGLATEWAVDVRHAMTSNPYVRVGYVSCVRFSRTP